MGVRRKGKSPAKRHASKRRRKSTTKKRPKAKSRPKARKRKRKRIKVSNRTKAMRKRWSKWYGTRMVSALENYLETRTDKAYDTFREYKRKLYRKYKLTYEQVYELLKHLKQFIPIHLIAKLS